MSALRPGMCRLAFLPLLACAAALLCAGPAFGDSVQQQTPNIEDFSGSVSGGYHLYNPKGNRATAGEYDVLDTGFESAFDLSGRSGTKYFDITGKVLDKNDQSFGMNLDFSRYLRSMLTYSRFQHSLQHDPLENQDSYTDYGRNAPDRLLIEELVSKNSVLLPQLPNVTFNFDYRTYQKRGHEQATTVSKCSTCHVTSKNKYVDRSTNDVTGGMEATFGPVTVAYSHLLRDFTEHAAAPRADYGDGASFFLVKGVAPYSLVPDSKMNVDSLSVRSALPLDSSIYAAVKHGRRENSYTGEDATFNSIATRLSKYFTKKIACDVYYNKYTLENKTSGGIDRKTEHGGFDLTTHPVKNSGMVMSYQWEDTDRDNADPKSTRKNIYRISWSQRLQNKLRLNMYFKKTRIDDPFVAHDPSFQLTQTSLPQKEDEWYGSVIWSPRYNLTVSGSLRFSNAKSSRYDSDEDRHEYLLSLWYAPAERLTLTASYTLQTTDVNSFGAMKVYHLRESDSLYTYDDFPYDGSSQAWFFSAAYQLTMKASLTGDFSVIDSRGDFDKHISGRNVGDYSDLSIRQVETSFGIAYALRRNLTLNAKYLYRVYNDRENGYYDGSVSLLSMGATWSF